MRHVFIINPVAGKHQAAPALVPEIEAFFATNPEFGTPEIVYTEAPGHATEIAKNACESGGSVRLYACGGDGTLAEVLQGMHRYKNAQLACIPCGSGNDYLRMFPERDFSNIAAQVSGNAKPMDLIRCGELVSLNIACMGMDADVAAKMTKYKHLPLVSGSMAYNLAVVDVFFHRLGKSLDITVDTGYGVQKRRGRYLFVLAASGQYYGGGYHGAPMAVPDDGVLDFVLIRTIPRLKILRFLSKYKKGEIADLPFAEHIRGHAMCVVCDEGATVALDGECITGTRMEFSLHTDPVAFVMPAVPGVKQPVFDKASSPVAGKQLKGAFVKKL